MTTLKTRNRLVNFRVTEEELQSLKMACLMKGARNTSDFARTAVLESVGAQVEPGSMIQGRLALMDSKLSQIELGLRCLGETLRGVLTGMVQDNGRDRGPARDLREQSC